MAVANVRNFRWEGERIANRLEEASVAAVAATTREAADYARVNHPWRNRTGEEQASVFVREPRVDGLMVRGFWGAESPAFYLEYGTQHMPAFPFLRPAADATYGRLIGRVRA